MGRIKLYENFDSESNGEFKNFNPVTDLDKIKSGTLIKYKNRKGEEEVGEVQSTYSHPTSNGKREYSIKVNNQSFGPKNIIAYQLHENSRVNESADFDDVATAADTLNFVYAMMDEGYIKNNKWTISSIEDLPARERDRFPSLQMEDAEEWLELLLPIISDFARKVSDFYE